MRSEAQKKADKKYNEKVRYVKNHPLNVTISVDDYKLIDDFCKNNCMSKASLVVKAIKYCIENDIDLKGE